MGETNYLLRELLDELRSLRELQEEVLEIIKDVADSYE